MTVPKINSAHGSDTRNIINRAIEVLNRLGIDVQTLVAEGQLTPEQFSELIRTINGLIKSGHVSLDDLSPDVLEAINSGDGASFEILSIPRDGSVTPEKTTFIDVSSNILDTSTLEDGFSISGSTGEKTVSFSNSVSDFLPVRNTENEKLSMIGVTQVARYDENKGYINSAYPGNESYLFTSSPTTHHIRVIVNIDKQDIAQINEGEELLPYEPYYKELDKSISAGTAVDQRVNDLVDALTAENEVWEDA